MRHLTHVTEARERYDVAPESTGIRGLDLSALPYLKLKRQTEAPTPVDAGAKTTMLDLSAAWSAATYLLVIIKVTTNRL
jgi:hypothetical protein